MQERRLQKQAADTRLDGAPHIIIDLSYYDLMTAKELRSLHQQLLYCYGKSRRAERPLKLELVNYQDDLLHLSNVDGFASWKVAFSQRIDTAARSCTYLTADSDTVIGPFSEGTTYVIGGLVDKNRHKNACLRRAEALGIPTGRVDIRACCTLRTSQVITVDQIYELMCLLHAGAPLAEAVQQSVPRRKVAPSTPVYDDGR